MRYLGRLTSSYFMGPGCEPWPEQTLVMKCDYCGSHGKDFQCRNCGAPVGPKRSMRRCESTVYEPLTERIEVTAFGDAKRTFIEVDA